MLRALTAQLTEITNMLIAEIFHRMDDNFDSINNLFRYLRCFLPQIGVNNRCLCLHVLDLLLEHGSVQCKVVSS